MQDLHRSIADHDQIVIDQWFLSVDLMALVRVILDNLVGLPHDLYIGTAY